MKEYVKHCKSTPFSRWDWIVVAAIVVIVVVLVVLIAVPQRAATKATVYVEGRAVATLDLTAEYNPVATYNGVLVRVNNGTLETVYKDRTATFCRIGDKAVYPTLGVVVELD